MLKGSIQQQTAKHPRKHVLKTNVTTINEGWKRHKDFTRILALSIYFREKADKEKSILPMPAIFAKVVALAPHTTYDF